MHGGSGGDSGHKSRSSARSRAKSQSRVGVLQPCTWMPEGDCAWRNTEWQCRAQVGSASLVSLSRAEAQMLALISLERINQLPGFKIPALPKDDDQPTKPHKSRRKPTALLKKKAVTTSFIEMSSKFENDTPLEDKTCFGVCLVRLLGQDAKIHGVESTLADVDSLHELTYSMRFKGSLDEEEIEEADQERRHSEDGTPWEMESDGTPSKKGKGAGAGRERTQSADLGASGAVSMSSMTGGMSAVSLLAVTESAGSEGGDEEPRGGRITRRTFASRTGGTSSTYSLNLSDERTGPRVPRVVNSCLRYLYKYGPTTVGVFRVSSSKRRVRQLRELFDSGSKQVERLLRVPDELASADSADSGEDTRWENWPKEWENWPRGGGGAHDVAQLLKEFFRDLPEPLMTRQLYSPFLSTLRLPREMQLLSVVHLIRLLPPANRDILWALLRLLRNICTHSSNKDDTLSGNKMDANNLATVLGPNILRTNPTPSASSGPKSFFVEKLERAEERSDVILVVRYLIENFERLFSVSAADMDAMYRRMLVEEPLQLENLFTDRFLSSNCDAPPRFTQGRRVLRDEVLVSSDQTHPLRDRGRKGILRRATEKTDYRELSRYRQSPAESTSSLRPAVYPVGPVQYGSRLNSSSSKDTSLTSLNDWDSTSGRLGTNHWDQSNFAAFVGAIQTPPSITVTLSNSRSKEKEKSKHQKSKTKSKSKYESAEAREQRSHALKKSKSASALLSGILFGGFRRDSDTSPSPSMDEDEYTAQRASSSYSTTTNTTISSSHSTYTGVCRRTDLISSECRRPRER
ncbi:rho GTPase-activating protein 6-like [Varroa destructor]|uniref:Rho-GAP domain-containing protein n=1 Tax=Varroa destructor TaxID=109461 RepID=A0A7M7JIT7_VARDE|nr:rho GTPase-activating protein 6-like [Varroa destructor]